MSHTLTKTLATVVFSAAVCIGAASANAAPPAPEPALIAGPADLAVLPYLGSAALLGCPVFDDRNTSTPVCEALKSFYAGILH